MRCIIICGSPDCSADFIRKTVSDGDYVMCADSGYGYALDAGVKPDLLVGDFDSYPCERPDDIPTITLNTHKDDSDSMHCAAVAVEKGFDEVVLLGTLGGRSDHSFSNLCVLLYLSERGVKASALSENEYVTVLTEGEHKLKNHKGKTFSVFPFGCDEAVVTYTGDVEYPADNLRMKTSDGIGLSNIFNSDDVSIIVSGGICLLFIETLM